MVCAEEVGEGALYLEWGAVGKLGVEGGDVERIGVGGDDAEELLGEETAA